MNTLAMIPSGKELLHTRPVTIVSRKDFVALLELAGRAAGPNSVPVLMMVELNGLRDGDFVPAVERQFVEAAALRLAATLGVDGYVSALHQGRLGVLTASDGAQSPAALGVALLAALARPLLVDGRALASGATLGAAVWGEDGDCTDALFVAADQQIHVARGEGPTALMQDTWRSVSFVDSPLRLHA